MLECISKVSKINNKSDKKWGRSQIMLEWIAYKAHNKNLINSGGRGQILLEWASKKTNKKCDKK